MADDLEAAVELAIAECDGDARAAVRSLILANAYLSAEVDRLAAAISAGFTRGRLRHETLLPENAEQRGGEQEQGEDDGSLLDTDAKPLAKRQ